MGKRSGREILILYTVAHAIYGIPLTINCANYVYFLAMDHCRNLGSPEALTIFLGIVHPLNIIMILI